MHLRSEATLCKFTLHRSIYLYIACIQLSYEAFRLLGKAEEFLKLHPAKYVGSFELFCISVTGDQR